MTTLYNHNNTSCSTIPSYNSPDFESFWNSWINQSREDILQYPQEYRDRVFQESLKARRKYFALKRLEEYKTILKTIPKTLNSRELIALEILKLYHQQ